MTSSWKNIFLTTLLLFASSSTFSSHANAKNKERKKGSILIHLKPDSDNESAIRLVLAKYGLTFDKKLFHGKVLKTKLVGKLLVSEEQIAKELTTLGLIQSAEVDYLAPQAYIPNDPLSQNQWHLKAINSAPAWDISMGSSTVKVMVCDAGIESFHPDLTNQMSLPGINTVDNSTTTSALNMHGTFCAGVIAATADNATGVTGVAGRVKVVPGRISNIASGDAYYSDMAECITWAADNGVKVVNLSYAGAESSTLDQAAQYLRAKGGLLVMSAGNAGTDISSTYPDFPSFVAVGAVGRDLNRTSWSNYGKPIDLVAPGIDIYSTQIGQTYAWGWGTSFSAPQVAGAAALIWSINPKFTPDDVEKILFASATDIGSAGDDNVYGHGLLNLGAAAELAVKTSPTPVPSMYSSNIGMALAFKNQQARATITVKDSKGALVPGATVQVTWSGSVSGTATGTTTTKGTVVLSSPKTRTSKALFRVTIQAISKSGYAYDPNLNIEVSDSITGP